MNELKNLKKKYPSKKNKIEKEENKSTNNENEKEIKAEDSNNILTLQNKYNKFNDLLENNIHIYGEKLGNINKELATIRELRKEKEIFLKEFSNNNYKNNLDKFILIRNKYLEKENELMREKTFLDKLNKTIDDYLIDLEKTEKLIKDDSVFFL